VTVQGLNLTNNGQGLLLAFTNDSKITGNNVQNNWDGIALTYSSNSTLSGNNVTANGEDGIRLLYSSNNSITGNNITNNSNGVYLHSSSDNTLSNNTLMSNRWVGISCGGASIIQLSSNNIIINNTVTSSVCGFQFWGGGEYYNTVENNIVYSNGAGIQLGDNARYNAFRGNTMSNNSYGLMIMNGPEDSKNYSNKIFHNNFIDNTMQVYTLTGGDNSWDDGYPSGGNYWSNYTGVDSDYDGIGDTPHVLDANNTDYYPLMGMFSDFNATSEHHVQTICNSTIADFQFNGTSISFDVSGENGTAGFCRICIPKALMNDTFMVFVNGTEILPSPEPLPCSNSTHSYLYFTYEHSTQEVVIIPEFPFLTLLPFLMIGILVAAMVYSKKTKPARNQIS